MLDEKFESDSEVVISWLLGKDEAHWLVREVWDQILERCLALVLHAGMFIEKLIMLQIGWPNQML